MKDSSSQFQQNQGNQGRGYPFSIVKYMNLKLNVDNLLENEIINEQDN